MADVEMFGDLTPVADPTAGVEQWGSGTARGSGTDDAATEERGGQGSSSAADPLGFGLADSTAVSGLEAAALQVPQQQDQAFGTLGVQYDGTSWYDVRMYNQGKFDAWDNPNNGSDDGKYAYSKLYNDYGVPTDTYYDGETAGPEH